MMERPAIPGLFVLRRPAMLRFCLPVLALLATTAPAWAQVDLLPEIRAGVFARDAGADLFDGGRIEDANVELLFAPGWGQLGLLGEIRPHIGATLNTAGHESLVYAGASWTVHVPVLPVWGEASLGAALHNGEWLDGDAPQRWGCTALLRASASVGVNVLPGAAVMLTAEHLTDGGACSGPDEGVTNVGVRAALRF